MVREKLALLAALLLPALSLLSHCGCPPFRRWTVRGLYRITALLPPGTISLNVCGARRLVGTLAILTAPSANQPDAERGCRLRHPRTGSSGLALLAALFLAALGFLCHLFLLRNPLSSPTRSAVSQ